MEILNQQNRLNYDALEVFFGKVDQLIRKKLESI
jgi:hypothetical protein